MVYMKYQGAYTLYEHREMFVYWKKLTNIYDPLMYWLDKEMLYINI